MPERSNPSAPSRGKVPSLPADNTARDTSRREFLHAFARYAGVLIVAPLVGSRLHALSPDAAAVAPVAVKVFKDASCGCCTEWIKHMQKAGFAVTSENSTDMTGIKKKLGVPDSLSSCHTAVVGDYLVEGHVPADVVQIMLKEKPAARGLAVPGMPMGSPGMEGPVKEKYNVMLFDRAGKSRVYASR
jgi:hypothetical protein